MRIQRVNSFSATVATQPVVTTRLGAGEGEACRARLEREIIGPFECPPGERYEDVIVRLLEGW